MAAKSTLIKDAALDGERTYDLFAFSAGQGNNVEIYAQVIGTEKPLLICLTFNDLGKLIELTEIPEKK